MLFYCLSLPAKPLNEISTLKGTDLVCSVHHSIPSLSNSSKQVVDAHKWMKNEKKEWVKVS